MAINAPSANKVLEWAPMFLALAIASSIIIINSTSSSVISII